MSFFDALITYDSVAQLGERMLDRHEVVGSSPIGIISTEKRLNLISKGLGAFFN